MYSAKNFEDAVDKAQKLVELGGWDILQFFYTDERKQTELMRFAKRLPTGRILINSPASHGAIVIYLTSD